MPAGSYRIDGPTLLSNKRIVTMRVVTLNLLHGAPIPGRRHARVSIETRLEWTSNRLAEERPDVILLQEASASARAGEYRRDTGP